MTKQLKKINFNLTPAGKVYFLSKLSGKIDVIKTNLDGTERHTVLAGVGTEEDRGTVLLATRDWKYLALLSRRDGLNPKLYLIDTSNDELTTIDGGASMTITPVGWSDKNFIYTISKQNALAWESGAEVLKSYNASNKQLVSLDQTKGEGTGTADYAHETYGNVYQIGKSVIYEKTWVAYYAKLDVLNGKQAAIYTISASGSSPQLLKGFSYDDDKTTYISSVPYKADQVYYQVSEKGSPNFYAYANGKVTAKSDISDEFNEYSGDGATTYLASPTSGETFGRKLAMVKIAYL